MPSLWADDLDAHRTLVLNRLLAAYEELRNEVGPDGVTLAAVAARAGLARSAVYNYVAHKHDLILTHAARSLADATRRLTEAVTGASSPPGALTAYVTQSLRIHAETAAAGDEVMGMLTPEERREFVALFRPMRDLLDGIIADGVADGSFNTEPEAAAELVWATIAGYRVAVATGRLEPEPTAAFAVDSLLRSLRAR